MVIPVFRGDSGSLLHAHTWGSMLTRLADMAGLGNGYSSHAQDQPQHDEELAGRQDEARHSHPETRE